ncbi:hypothetical protein [Ekhidna sp.]|uniref:hypothetical protein n=1 Tax=Ekhidna sp. TaxID=2608089 RepID=UPI00351216EC
MENETINWKDFHHQIYQIYHGIIALTLVPFALLFLEWDTSSIDERMDNLLFILSILLVCLVAYASWYVWRGAKVQYRLGEKMELIDKLREFKRVNTKKYLILGVAGITMAGAMWLAPSFILVIAYFSILVQYSFLRPSEDKFVRDMRLTKADRQKLHEK